MRHVAVPPMVDVTKLNNFTFFRFFLLQNHYFFLVHTHSAPNQFYTHMYIIILSNVKKIMRNKRKNVAAEKKFFFFHCFDSIAIDELSFANNPIN